MPQSLAKMNVHIVFSTKYRRPMMKPEIQQQLYAFIGNEIKKMHGVPLQINGIEDHIHILSSLPRTVTIAHFVEEIKRNSSKWIKSKGLDYRFFYWQRGYSIFSVSESQKQRVYNYIARQKVHHKKCNFENEYLDFLQKHQLDYDEKYIWD